jgi:WD40 repeat protein
LSLSASGDRVLGCDRHGGREIGVWNFATTNFLTLTAPDLLDNADWAGDDRIVAGSIQGRIHVWSATSDQLLHSISAHEENVDQVRCNHRGDLVASTGWDGTTRFCNPWTGQLYGTFPRHSWAAQFSLDDRVFSLAQLSIGPKGEVAFLEIEESSAVKRIEHGGTLKNAWTLAFSPDGRWLAAAHSHDGGVRLYETDTRRLLASLPESNGRMVLFEPDGKSLLTGGPEGISRWPLIRASDGGTNTVSFGIRQPISKLQNVLYGALTPNGRWLACTCERARDQVWLLDLEDPDTPIALGQHYSGMSVAISPDGEWVASGNWHGTEGLKIWRTKTRTLEKTIPMGNVLLACSPDGRWLAVSGVSADHSFQIQVWETGSWTLRHSWTDPSHRNQPAFSPDSRIVAFVSERRKTRLLEVETFRHLATLEAPCRTFITWLQFSPDGHRLAAFEWTHGIQLWDLPPLRQELRARGLDWEAEPLVMPDHP